MGNEYAKEAKALNKLGDKMFKKKHYTDAMKYYIESIKMMEETLETDPYSMIFNSNVAIRLYIAERYDDARNILNEHVRRNPDDASAYYYLAVSYAHQDIKVDALENLKKAIQLDSNLKDKARADEELKLLLDVDDFKRITLG